MLPRLPLGVFNSKSPTKENTHSFNHAKDVIGVQKMIKKGVDIIIMCAHYKRFEHSIIDLLNILEDSRSIKKEIVIHIDEAHAYVPRFRDYVIKMNSFTNFEKIN